MCAYVWVCVSRRVWLYVCVWVGVRVRVCMRTEEEEEGHRRREEGAESSRVTVGSRQRFHWIGLDIGLQSIQFNSIQFNSIRFGMEWNGMEWNGVNEIGNQNWNG